MKILYDYQMFSIQKYGGITRYFCEIIKNLPTGFEPYLPLLFTENQHANQNRNLFKRTTFIPSQQFKGKFYLKNFLNYLNHYYSIRNIKSNKFDLFHPTFYNNYYFKDLKKPFVITVHDLILFKVNNEDYNSHPRRIEMKLAIENANRVIAISENTKKDIIEVFKINPDIIDVVHHGFYKPKTLNSPNKFGNYILFVGQRSHHKNFDLFIEAASKILARESNVKLICVGPPFSESEKNNLARLKIIQQVIAMNVTDNILNNLYAHALIFVYPSLYEGFGMPILEAFANGCPVCLSNTSCFPEIAGNAGVFFDPFNLDSIYSAIDGLIYNNQLKEEKRELGKIRLTEFSWEKAARETAACYQRAIYPLEKA